MASTSLKALRLRVARAKKKEKVRLEKKRLKREVFSLENPRLAAGAKALKTGAKVAGKGAVRTVRGIQDFAVAQQKKAPKRRKGKSDDFGFNNPLTGDFF